MRHTIALHLPSAEHRASVTAALRRVAARVTVHATPEAALDDFIDGRPADVLVTALRDAAGRSTGTLLRRVHAAFPDVAIVAYGSLSPQFARDLLDAASCSGSEVVLHGFDDIALLARRLIDRATGRRVADVALAAVDDRLSRVTRPVVGYCLASAHTPATVDQLATVFGVRRKTVAAWLRADGLPPASTMVGWGRVLLAARYLEDGERSVERVALGLGFDSGSALRHMKSRYTNLRTSEIRARGGFAGLLPLFARALARPPESSAVW